MPEWRGGDRPSKSRIPGSAGSGAARRGGYVLKTAATADTADTSPASVRSPGETPLPYKPRNVPKPFSTDQLLRFASLGVQRLAFVRRHQSVVVGGDEQHRTRCDLVDDPFGVKPDGVVDEFERDLVDRPRIARRAAAAVADCRSGCRTGCDRLTRTPGHHATDTIGLGPRQQVGELVGPANAAHPAAAVPDADNRHNGLHPRIDRRGPNDGRAAVAGAIDAEPAPHPPWAAHPGRSGPPEINDAAVGRQA